MMKQPVRTNVSDFIKSTMGSQFVIPVYQRNYTWTPEVETARFMNDIEDLLARRTRTHFLGILIYTEAEVSAMYREIQIVDGQQRLTTSFIFLLCLKRAASENRDKVSTGMIDDYYLYNRHVSSEAKLRLKSTVSDDDTYERLVYGSWKDLTRAQKESSVYRNYDYIYRRVIELMKKYSLLDILDTLSRLDILAFPLSEEDNAQQIFESINSTGAPLTSADLIRNYILMNDTSEVQERNYRLYWRPLEIACPQSRKLEEFFRLFLAAKTYSLLSRRDVYEGFKAYWNSCRESTEERMREINLYCRYYRTIYIGPAEDPQVEHVLRDFRRSESRVPAPFLMEMFRMADDGEIDARTLCSEIRLIDSYLTRRALCGNDNGTLTRYFPQLLRSVMNSWKKKHRNVYEITKVFLINYNRGKSLAMPTNGQLKTMLREVNAYSLLCIRPVLERIEHHGATAEVDTSDLNIEHIMPQHPNNWWKRNSGARDEEEYTYYANLIGNLTLCAEYDNTRMGNQDFQFKKKILSKTMHIRMNTDLLNRETWTVNDILTRCDRLAREIIEIYPYEGGVEPAADERDDDIILLNTPSVNARALYVNPQCIEILAGSTMRAYGPNEMKSMQSIYRDMTMNGVLYEDENGQVQFDKNFRFSDLNTAAQFLMHRGGDNTQAWTRENGQVFLQKKEPSEPPKKPESVQAVKKDTQGQAKRKRRKNTESNTKKKETSSEPSKAASSRKTASAKKSSASGNTKKQAGKKEPEPSGNVEVRRYSRKTAEDKAAEEEKAGRQKTEEKKEAVKKAEEQKTEEHRPAKEEKKGGFLKTLFGLRSK